MQSPYQGLATAFHQVYRFDYGSENEGYRWDLGLSLVTISKALRDHPDISHKTRERVKARVEELGYRPNLAARSLVTGRSSLVGLIVPDLIYPFFAEVAKGLSRVLRDHGYFVLVSSSEEDPLLEQNEIQHMLAHRLDALVLASCRADSDPPWNARMGDTPLVMLDRLIEGVHGHFVGSDDYAVGKVATEHLLAMRCKRIAHIRGRDNSTGKRRLKGFLDTLKRRGIPVPPDYIVEARSVDVDGMTYGAEALSQLDRLPKRPDGIFCYNDAVATGVIRQAVAQGVSVPQELAVIGCGNNHFDELLQVPLSSVDQRSSEIGERTAKLVLELVAEKANPSIDLRKIIIQPRLAARISTMRPRTPRTA